MAMTQLGSVIYFLLRPLIFAYLVMVIWVLAISPAAAEDSSLKFPQYETMSPLSVDLQSGRFAYSKTDISIGPLALTRTFATSGYYHPDDHVFGIRFGGERSSGWSHNFGEGIFGGAPNIYIYVGGIEYKFVILSSGAIDAANKPAQGTSFNAVTGVFTDKSGNRFTFAGYSGLNGGSLNHRIRRAEFADGRSEDFSYNSLNVKIVKSNLGYALVFDYDAFGNVTAVCGFNLALISVSLNTTCSGSALKVTYGYDAAGSHLTSVTSVEGAVTTISGSYVYGGNQVIGPTCISIPGSLTCAIRNYYNTMPAGLCCSKVYQVGKQLTADGGEWVYSYDPEPNLADEPYTVGYPRWSSATMVDPLGRSRSVWFDRGVLVDIYETTGKTKQRYMERGGTIGGVTYDLHDTSPALVTFPDGHSEYFTHDVRGNVTFRFVYPKSKPATSIMTEAGSYLISQSSTALADCCVSAYLPNTNGTIFEAATFLPSAYAAGAAYPIGCGQGDADAKLCNKATSFFDFNGNKTDLTYAADHGGMLSKTGPADPSGIRPQVRNTYVQRYAWTINSSGTGYVKSATGVWLLNTTSTCKTGAAAATGGGCAVAGDEVKTTFDYGPDSGPNNLQLRGILQQFDGQSLRTCYGYDWMGNRISETKPRANLGACP